MAGTHKFQIKLRPTDFFQREGAMCVKKYAHDPHAGRTCQSHIPDLLTSIAKSIARQPDKRLYTPSIHGSRSAMLKRLVKTVNYWTLAYSDSTKTITYKQHVTIDGDYGNVRFLGTIDLNKYTITSSKVENGYANKRITANGRIIVEIVPVLESYLQAGRVRRFFARLFPKLVSTKHNKFKTTFSLKLRLWADPFNYYEREVYSLTVADNIVPPMNSKSSEIKKDMEQYERFSFYFRFGRSVRCSEVR